MISVFIRIRLEIYDYDPNLGFENRTMEELDYILKTLDNEEEVATAAIHEKYLQLKEMYSRCSELKRPPRQQETDCANVLSARPCSQKKKKKKKKKF